MKTAEQQEDELLVTIGRLSYFANRNDWNRFETILREFTNQVQSDAIESTVRKCAEMILPDNVSIDTISDSIARTQYEQRKESKRLILSLIPQKEKKV